MILAPICSLISLSTKADAQQRHTGASYWLLIDSLLAAVLVGWCLLYWGATFCENCRLHLFSTALTLLLLGHLRHAVPQDLCTYCFFSACTSWQKCLSSTLSRWLPSSLPCMALFKYLIRQTFSDRKSVV